MFVYIYIYIYFHPPRSQNHPKHSLKVTMSFTVYIIKLLTFYFQHILLTKIAVATIAPSIHSILVQIYCSLIGWNLDVTSREIIVHEESSSSQNSLNNISHYSSKVLLVNSSQEWSSVFFQWALWVLSWFEWEMSPSSTYLNTWYPASGTTTGSRFGGFITLPTSSFLPSLSRTFTVM